MSEWLYTLRFRFTPHSADTWVNWNDFLTYSGFSSIVEVVTLDDILCPDLIVDLKDEDWHYNVHEDFRTHLFRDPNYLLSRQSLDPARHQVLAVLERPDGTESIPAGFTWCGYDIMDVYFGNSTLTNCGQIPEAFNPSMVNQFGLLPDCATALRIRDKMRQIGPDDDHLGNCEVWSVARVLPIA